MAASYDNSTADVDTKPKKENVMTGPLSDDFLRISQQEDAVDVQQQAAYGNMFNGFQQAGGILTITVIQARLAKNYGVTRMDPYCRLRIVILTMQQKKYIWKYLTNVHFQLMNALLGD